MLKLNIWNKQLGQGQEFRICYNKLVRNAWYILKTPKGEVQNITAASQNLLKYTFMCCYYH